jgi:hypothetical protein
MKHVANITKKHAPAKAESLLAKEHMIANIADAVDVAEDIVRFAKASEDDG